MSIQIRESDGMMRQFCRWCENEYGHEFNPHGPWLPPSLENKTEIERMEREHDWNHLPAILKAGREAP